MAHFQKGYCMYCMLEQEGVSDPKRETRMDAGVSGPRRETRMSIHLVSLLGSMTPGLLFKHAVQLLINLLIF